MTTVFPGLVDQFGNPINPTTTQLGTANTTRKHSEQHSDLNDAIEAVEAVLVGPAFLNPQGQTPVLAETLINDATAGSINPGTWFTSGNLDPGGFVNVFGRPSWQNGTLKLGFAETSMVQPSYSGINFTTPIPVGGNGGISVWIAWDTQSAGSSSRNGTTHAPVEILELVVSDGPTLTGNVVTMRPIYGLSTKQVFAQQFIQLYGLTTIKCIGVRQTRLIPYPGGDESKKILQGAMAFATATELEVAMANVTSTSVIIPPNWTPSVAAHFDVQTPKNIVKLDLRAKKHSLSGFEGIKRFSDFEGTVDDGSAPMNFYLQHAINQLEEGDTLQFNRNGKYDLTIGGIAVRSKKNITLDFNGATFYTLGQTGAMWTLQHNSGLRLMSSGRKARMVHKHANIGTGANAGNTLVASSGATPSGSTMTLPNWGATASSLDPFWFTENEDGFIEADFTLSQTGAAAQDCYIELVQANAPPAPGVTASATSGAVQGGGTVYFYRLSWVDAEGKESGMGTYGSNVLSSAWGQMTLTLPVPTKPTSGIPIVAKRIYRGTSTSQMAMMDPVVTVPAAWTTWTDNSSYPGVNPFSLTLPSIADAGAGNIAPGSYAWYVTQIDSTGRETRAPYDESGVENSGRRNGTTTGSMTLTLPSWTGVSRMRVYRSGLGLAGPLGAFFVGEPTAGALTYVDNTASADHHQMAPIWRNPDGIIQIVKPPVTPELKLTLTTTPTLYKVKLPHTQRSMDDLMKWRIIKASSAVNTITVHSFTNYTALKIAGNSQPYQGGDGLQNRRDGSPCFSFSDDNYGTTIENVAVYKPLGDAFFFQNSKSGMNQRGWLIKDVDIFAQGRQGFSLMSGGDWRLENIRARGGGGQTIDIEWEHGDRDTVELINFESYNPEVTHLALVDKVRGIVMRGCRFINTYGNTGAEVNFTSMSHADIRDCDFPYLNVAIAGGRIFIDNITAGTLVVSPAGWHGSAVGGEWWNGDGAVISNVRLTPVMNASAPFACNMTTSFVSNITTTYPFDALTPGVSNILFGGPFQMTQSGPQFDNLLQPNSMVNLIHGGKASAALLDPGPWKTRYPDTWKGTIVGTDPHFPTGLNMLDESVLNVRGISSTTTRPNNLRISATVAAGATSATLTFPVQPYADLTYAQATASVLAGATLAPATYFYRVAARTASGGPRASASNEAPVAIGGANNSSLLTFGSFLGATAYIEGLTVYRGTASGVYTVRFDLVPTSAVFTMAVAADGRHVFHDTGPGFYVDSGRAIGYSPDILAATPTAAYVGSPAWDGTKWITSVDQTGYEADKEYSVLVDTSWATTVGVTKTVAGVTLAFGTACPGGGGTVSCVIVR